MKKISLSLFIILMFVIGIASNSPISATNTDLELVDQNEINDFDISNWWWENTTILTSESTAHSYFANPALDSEGNIHVVWHDVTDILGSGADWDIFYMKWDANIETCGTTEVLSTESTGDSDEASIVIDSEDNLHVIWHDDTDLSSCGTDWDIFYKRYDSATAAWETTEVVSTESTADAFDASFGIDQAGNIFVAWEDATDDDVEGDKDIYLKKKDALTSVWGGVEDISSVSNDASNDPHLVIDSNGDVHVAWIDSFSLDADPDDDVFYRVLDSDTDTWSATEVLSTVGAVDSGRVFLAVDSSDNIHIAYEDYADYMGSGIGEKDIFYKYKVAATGIWSTTELVTPESTEVSQFPYMTIDSANTIHMVFVDATADFDEHGSDYDIFYTYKDSLTTEWAKMQLISHESIISTIWGLPAIVIDGNGYYHVFWTDSSDIYGAGFDNDIHYKRFVGPPQAPHVYSITPNPSVTGNVSLNWTDVPASDIYHVYREETQINALSGLSSISSTADSFYDDVILDNSTYYYVVVAENEFGKSSISNVEYLQTIILPDIDIDFTAGNSSNLLPFMSDELLAIVGSLLGLQIIFFVVSLLLKKK